MGFKHLIYDFDGTISDTYPCFTEALLKLLREYSLEDTYEGAYKKLKVSVGYALSRYDFPISKSEASARFEQIHHEMVDTLQFPFAEAEEILRYATALGKKNYLYTHSGEIATRLLRKWGLYDYFEYIIDATQGFPLKPAPDALNNLVEMYQLNPEECIMIGDRDIDTDCGHAAHMSGCLFDTEHYYDACVCEHRISNLLQLKEII